MLNKYFHNPTPPYGCKLKITCYFASKTFFIFSAFSNFTILPCSSVSRISGCECWLVVSFHFSPQPFLNEVCFSCLYFSKLSVHNFLDICHIRFVRWRKYLQSVHLQPGSWKSSQAAQIIITLNWANLSGLHANLRKLAIFDKVLKKPNSSVFQFPDSKLDLLSARVEEIYNWVLIITIILNRSKFSLYNKYPLAEKNS